MFMPTRYNFFSTTCHKCTLGEQSIALPILNHDASWVWVVKTTSSASHKGKDAGTLYTRGLVGPRDGVEVCGLENLAIAEVRNPNRNFKYN